MDKDHLIKQLNTLKHKRAGGLARQAWIADAKKIIMQKAEEDCQILQASETRGDKQLRLVFDMGRDWHRMFRPVVAMGLVVIMVFGGWITSVGASQNSLPGEALYKLKLFSEQAQAAITSSGESKVKLHVEFAGRRLDEVAKLIDSSVLEKEQKVGQAVDGFKKQIDSVHEDLDNIKDKKVTKKKDSDKFVEVTKIVDKKAVEYQDALDQTVDKVVVSKDKIKGAREAVNEVEAKAVEVLVEKHLSGELYISEEEVSETIQGKLDKAKQDIDQAKFQLDELGRPAGGEAIDGDKIVNEEDEGSSQKEGGAGTVTQIGEVEGKIQQGEALLQNKDYTGAMGKVKEVKTITMEVKEGIAQTKIVMEEENKADAEQGLSADGLSQGVVAPGSETSSTTLKIEDGLLSGQSATTTQEIIEE
ncbi:hypothetical protein KKD84_02820 [Patescibacteria group bacterium]|nr:hypothetical protein [Patescibacteria group bacterium]